MLKVWWFNEFSPQQQIVFDKMLAIVEGNYKQFGFTHINTPAVERNDVLTAKSGEDASKQIFGLYWLAQWNSDTKEYSLHFDLTVPFARYVLDWENELSFPFKRYQIQPVWRGERQQKGRFKEFYQADIDVIWKTDCEKDQGLYYDAECIFVFYKSMVEICTNMELEGDSPVLHLNNRKINWALIDSIIWVDREKKQKVFNLIDKFEKIWEEKFKKSLEDLWLNMEQVQKIFEFMKLELNIDNLLEYSDFVDSDEFKKWIRELYELISLIEKLSSSFGVKLKYKVDFAIMRWLDYYTWTVFEAFFQNNKWLWSIGWWGRYDNLTTHINPKTNYSGVWWSIGVDRLITIILDKISIDNVQKTVSDYIFINFEETFDEILKLAGKFAKEGKNIEIYPNADKIKKQFQYANKKGIWHVVVLWEEELSQWVYKLKDMKSGEEETIQL